MTLLDELLRIAAAYPDRTALIHDLGADKHEAISFGDLARRSLRLAHHLRRHGVEPGDTIGIFMERSIHHVLAMIAAWRAGAACYSINPKHSAEQIDSIVRAARSRILIVDDRALARLGARLRDIGDVRLVHLAAASSSLAAAASPVLAADPDRIRSVSLDEDTDQTSLPAVLADDLAVILFTSGSTGAQKGVLITHRDVRDRVITEREDFCLTPEDRLLNLLPFSFDVGLNQLLTALVTGARLIISTAWLAKDMSALIRRWEITGMSSVPALLAGILAHPEAEVRACLDALRYFTISGGDMAPEQLRRLRELAPKASIYKTYGQSETFRSAILAPEDFDRKITSVGRPVRGTEVFIVTDDGRLAGPDEPGEILHRGHGTMLGYAGDPGATAEKIRNHPLRSPAVMAPQQVVFTGDIGVLDADGYLYLLGRKDKMMKVHGNRVYPAEIVNAIVAHPDVQEAAVVGIKAGGSDSELYAEILPRPGASLDTAAMLRHLSKRLPSYMIPRHIAFVDEFPRTSSGKIALAAIEANYHETR